MKKFAFILSALLISNVLCMAQTNVPAFDDPKATIFDVASVKGSFKDNIKLVNETDDFDIYFDVSFYHSKKNTWINCERAHLKGLYDSESVDVEMEDFASRCSYIAITPVSGKQYKYTTEKSHNDFIITITEINPKVVSTKDLSTFELSEVKGGFLRDGVRFYNESNDAKMFFSIYVSNDNETWEKYGSSYLKEFGDSDSVDSYKKITKYKYIGIRAESGKQHNYVLKIGSHDLNVKVQD